MLIYVCDAIAIRVISLPGSVNCKLIEATILQLSRRDCVYRKLKSDYNGDEVRQGWRVNE